MERNLIAGVSWSGGLCALRGMWQFLGARSRARAKVEIARIALAKDRARSQAVAGYISDLPDGAELLDIEDKAGRSIWIRKTGCPPLEPPAALRSRMALLPVEAPRVGPLPHEGLWTDETAS